MAGYKTYNTATATAMNYEHDEDHDDDVTFFWEEGGSRSGVDRTSGGNSFMTHDTPLNHFHP